MDRELLIEFGVEEIPAGWLPGLTRQLAQVTDAQVKALRLDADAKAETHSTPRRLAVLVPRLAERQTDLEELVTGPRASEATGPDGQPAAGALGFAKKHGVTVADLERAETPKGTYLAYRKRQRGKATVDALPELMTGILRGLSFPRHMHWDACLEDGKGELTFGRPIRWILFLYGGRVVPFEIRRNDNAAGPLVQDVRSGAVTYGHRFLTTSGRAGRAIKVKTFDDYRARLMEHFVILSREERRERIVRELDLHARRLGGRVHRPAAARAGLLEEVPDLVEYPSVVAGTFTTRSVRPSLSITSRTRSSTPMPDESMNASCSASIVSGPCASLCAKRSRESSNSDAFSMSYSPRNGNLRSAMVRPLQVKTLPPGPARRPATASRPTEPALEAR